MPLKTNAFLTFLFLFSFVLSEETKAQEQDFQFDTITQTSHCLLIETTRLDYKDMTEKIRKLNKENEQDFLRVGDFPFDDDTAFVFVKNFKSLNSCRYYYTNLLNTDLTSGTRVLPISLHNYRRILSRKDTFATYETFYEEYLKTRY